MLRPFLRSAVSRQLCSRQLHNLQNLRCAASAPKHIHSMRISHVLEVANLVHRSTVWQQTAAFSSSVRHFKQISVVFVEPDGNKVKATGEEGTNLMELAHENDVDLEGACEGACACSTCHVILEDKIYDDLPEPSDEENDMLDLAFGLTDTSRLGCQVELTPEMEGMVIKLPAATRNFYVDGAKPAHH